MVLLAGICNTHPSYQPLVIQYNFSLYLVCEKFPNTRPSDDDVCGTEPFPGSIHWLNFRLLLQLTKIHRTTWLYDFEDQDMKQKTLGDTRRSRHGIRRYQILRGVISWKNRACKLLGMSCKSDATASLSIEKHFYEINPNLHDNPT
jgi:hypothetical protein